MSDRHAMTRADYLRQIHVAKARGFRTMDLVEVTGSFKNPAHGETAGLGVVYSIHLRTRIASVAMACWNGKKSTSIGLLFMRHYNGPLTAELVSTLKSTKKLIQQLGSYAPPEKGWDD